MRQVAAVVAVVVCVAAMPVPSAAEEELPEAVEQAPSAVQGLAAFATIAGLLLDIWFRLGGPDERQQTVLEAANDLDRRFQALESDVDGLQEDVASINATLEAVNTRLAGIREDIRSMR